VTGTEAPRNTVLTATFQTNLSCLVASLIYFLPLFLVYIYSRVRSKLFVLDRIPQSFSSIPDLLFSLVTSISIVIPASANTSSKTLILMLIDSVFYILGKISVPYANFDTHSCSGYANTFVSCMPLFS